jgi:hypothetical protein
MVPQVREPGVEGEVDFFEAMVRMAGDTIKLLFFQMRACYSGRVFVRAVVRPTQQAFLEAMTAGFAHFEGVFHEVRMDNHRLAVERVMRGRERVETERFIAFRSHYLFQSQFCQVGLKGAHEKGGVENGQGHFRRNHLVPVPECRDLDDLNRQLLESCSREDERIPEGRQITKLEAWQEEKPRLLPLPTSPFDSAEYADSIRVDDKSRARVKKVRYSVPCQLAGRMVRAEVSSQRVLLFHQGEQVGNWERCWEPQADRLDLDHYLEVFLRKPGAFWRSLPLKQAQTQGRWPDCYTELFAKLKERLGETAAARQMVEVLLLCRQHPTELVTQAVQGAVTAGAYDGQAVVVLLRRMVTGRPPLVVLDVGTLDVYHRSQPQIDAYDQLLQAVPAMTASLLPARDDGVTMDSPSLVEGGQL